MRNRLRYGYLMTVMVLHGACTKTYLDKKPNSSIVVPTRLEELRGLLDNETIVFETPTLGTQSADEYYFKYEDWQAMNPKERNAYVWAKDLYEGHAFNIKDWDVPYQQIFYSNIVLEAFHMGTVDSLSDEARSIMGNAYFLRGRALFNLAEHFAMPYDEQTAHNLPGIPFKTNPDVVVYAKRGSLSDTYKQILSDMQRARNLLVDKSFLENKLRVNRLTVWSYLSRFSLSMRDYQSAMQYADSALTAYDYLIDYNGISPTQINPFPVNNRETILQSRMISGVRDLSTTSGTLHVDSNLYNFYSSDDLRKTLWFQNVSGRILMNRSYAGLIQFFSGMTTAELLLIRAECRVRLNQSTGALEDLNKLLVKRYKSGTFNPITLSDSPVLLDRILLERRKELILRGLRWSDIRRLNLEGRGIVLTRKLKDDLYELQPGDPRYALPIPDAEIELSGFEQNIR
ncbi:RagB/SusD family nutrient uptake outer membrane protein [Sphingobacterium sp. SG20118]|uniref:RagB/SusD family nutrient uptake outer membrane protein n=1 Tax=Sphingobacterium sp. SG20118 TaxID=3367156 RepID=UPI0037DFC776